MIPIIVTASTRGSIELARYGYTSTREILAKVERLRRPAFETQLPEQPGETFGEALPLFDQRQEPSPKASALDDQRWLRHQKCVYVIEVEPRAHGHVHQSESGCRDGGLAAKVVE